MQAGDDHPADTSARARPEGTERIGILGGTFDPPHAGHVALAQAALDQHGLDRVLLVVAGDPWHKGDDVRASADERLAMAHAAFADLPGIEVSAIEVERSGPTYTVDTLEALAAPGRDLFLIVGVDVAESLHSWQRPHDVAALATLLVADRPGAPRSAEAVVAHLTGEGWRAAPVALAHHDISSTDIRERLAGGGDVGGDVPAPVVRVVEERGLYTRPQ